MEKFFKLKENGTTVKTELFAGLTTFMAMAYILMVNAGMFADPFSNGENVLGVSYGAIYIATAISAIVGTILIGLLANLPMAQASGMGLNAFFVYTACVGFGLSYANALVLILVDGLVFIILTATGLRKIIFDAIPKAVKVAIPAGIGLFIAFIGLQNAKLVVDDSATLVNLASFNILSKDFSWAATAPLLVTIITLIAIAVLSYKKVRGAILYGIIGGSALNYVMAYFSTTYNTGITNSFTFNPLADFKAFGTEAFGKVFTEGFDFTNYIAAHGSANLILVIVTTALAFCMVDMFDTLGTLYGACARGNLLDENGDVPRVNKAMLADAVATTTGAICGTSTVTTFVESSAGVAEGGRTGLTSMFTALFFLIAMFLSPVASAIPGCATAAALIYVGVLMMNCVKDIDWLDASVAVPGFLTMAMMAFTYNISYGIAFGIISYLFIKVFAGKIKEVKVSTWVIALLFIGMFVLTH